MATDSEYLRAQAKRMFALALGTRDAELSQKLTIKAADYFDQVMELEREHVPQHPKPEPEPA
jgi:hypothetical protein